MAVTLLEWTLIFPLTPTIWDAAVFQPDCACLLPGVKLCSCGRALAAVALAASLLDASHKLLPQQNKHSLLTVTDILLLTVTDIKVYADVCH